MQDGQYKELAVEVKVIGVVAEMFARCLKLPVELGLWTKGS